MENNIDIQEVYEPKFEQLMPGEPQPLNAVEAVSEAEMELEVVVGSTHEKIGKIVNFKVGEVIELRKNLEEPLDININGANIASGESVIMQDRIAVRLSKVKTTQEEY